MTAKIYPQEMRHSIRVWPFLLVAGVLGAISQFGPDLPKKETHKPDPIPTERAMGAVFAIIESGYVCNNVTSITKRYATHDKFTILCEPHYRYDVLDVGGRWKVTPRDD